MGLTRSNKRQSGLCIYQTLLIETEQEEPPIKKLFLCPLDNTFPGTFTDVAVKDKSSH